ncbi:hypothetical protein [Candidatus Nitrospira neomarina]|uniref:Uncharacterized protein n=1 Tax=Candidatus Nitrospira neomarina TaxID=3020899 RepID=A0AA96GT19_9BACT|nr:hypothetical protein [Candidatus Nitrospira neomarina]WNM63559.1 hypothetical protein PQG83_07345 [Candidatus Nitrospira neomarina]GJL84163.1 MAG: hypothetical protein DHS20C01_37970 [marine bacterium B5-7]
MKTKTFDCVEMKHQGAEQLKKTIDQLTDQEKLAFWSERTHELKQRMATAKTRKESSGNTSSTDSSTMHK